MSLTPIILINNKNIRMQKFIIILAGFVLLASCHKPETIRYSKQDAAISFYYPRTIESDSLNYSFANQFEIKTKDTVFLKMRINGLPMNKLRAIAVEAAEGTTAKENIHFILPKINLPADSITINYPVILLNTPDLKDTTLSLFVKIVPTEDFKPGAVGTIGTTSLTVLVNNYKIKFSNRLMPPSFSWNYLSGYFGAYSNVKYDFMIKNLKINDFRPVTLGGSLTRSDLLALKQKIGTILTQYELVNGPLMDENGRRVTFPL